MANVESVNNWFRAREGKVTYSMDYRYGPSSYDCSSAVFYALIEAGFLPVGTGIGSTESLYALEGSLLQRISRSEVKRGDIFISGGRGTSAGANGHTGVFVSNSRIIHCNYGSNGISETSAEGGWMGGPPNDFYRLKGATSEQPKIPEGDEEIMFMYWATRSDGKTKDAFGVMGGNRVHLKTQEEISALKNICKQTTGRELKEYSWTGTHPVTKFVERITNFNA